MTSSILRPEQPLGRAHLPGLAEELGQLFGVEPAEAAQDAGVAAVVVGGEELLRVAGDELLPILHRMSPQDQDPGLVVDTGEDPSRDVEGRGAVCRSLADLRKRKGEATDVVIGADASSSGGERARGLRRGRSPGSAGAPSTAELTLMALTRGRAGSAPMSQDRDRHCGDRASSPSDRLTA